MHKDHISVRMRDESSWRIGLMLSAILLMASCRGGSMGPAQSAKALPADQHLRRFECIAPCMGMQARIVMFAADQAQAKQAGDAAIEQMQRLDQLLSDFRDDSETALVNRAAGGEPIKVSEPFLDVLQAALEVSRLSDGAFDVTIGPVTHLWRDAKRENRTPSEAEIATAHSAVDCRGVIVDRAAGTVRLVNPDARLDFGGIGKGFAVDRAFEVLRAHGIARALVAIAGDIRAGDPPPGRTGWSIAIDDGLSEAASLVELANCGISTSGDAEQHLMLDGQRHSHIVNPRTGLGLTDSVAVSVVARDDTTADALATALSIMPAGQALRLAESIPETAARIVRIRDGRLIILTSRGFPPASLPAPE